MNIGLILTSRDTDSKSTRTRDIRENFNLEQTAPIELGNSALNNRHSSASAKKEKEEKEGKKEKGRTGGLGGVR